MNWEVAELLGYTYYAKKGYRILVPVVRTDGYDFVAERNGDFIRVNVKLAGLKDKIQKDSWCISQASGSVSGHTDCHTVDVYLVWLPHLRTFIEVPGEFLNGGNSKSKRLPKEYLV